MQNKQSTLEQVHQSVTRAVVVWVRPVRCESFFEFCNCRFLIVDFGRHFFSHVFDFQDNVRQFDVVCLGCLLNYLLRLGHLAVGVQPGHRLVHEPSNSIVLNFSCLKVFWAQKQFIFKAIILYLSYKSITKEPEEGKAGKTRETDGELQVHPVGEEVGQDR